MSLWILLVVHRCYSWPQAHHPQSCVVVQVTPEKSKTAAKLVAVASAFAFTFCCVPPTPYSTEVLCSGCVCLFMRQGLSVQSCCLPLNSQRCWIKGVLHHTWPCALILKCCNYSFIKILKVIFIVSNYTLSIFVVFILRLKDRIFFREVYLDISYLKQWFATQKIMNLRSFLRFSQVNLTLRKQSGAAK